jgi:hypothetical protein
LGEGDLSSFPVSVLSLSLLYIVAGIASLWHPVVPSPYAISSTFVILRARRPKNLNERLRINSAKNLVFVFRINPAEQFEEINVVGQ